MKKKILSFLLALCLIVALVPMTAFAAEAPSFSGGTGTEEDPWLIASQKDIIALAEFLNSGNAQVMQRNLMLKKQVLGTVMATILSKLLILI